MSASGKPVSERTIGRLSLYRRVLNVLRDEGADYVFSHQLAKMAGRSAAQVRRDLMAVGYTGSTTRGYDVEGLIRSLRDFLDAPGGQGVALVGVGKLGRALLSYFTGRRPNLKIVVAFDKDPSMANRVIQGCRCYPPERMAEVLKARDVHVAIIAVPAEVAQQVTDTLVATGVRGILNFAPAWLHVPEGIHVEDIDMTMSIEKVAYFARGDVGPKASGRR